MLLKGSNTPWITKMKMQMCVLFLLGILLQVQESGCQCTFPIQGNWYMSKNNERLTFQGSTVVGFTFEGGPLLQNTLTSTYNCIATDGSRYVIQSNVGAIEGTRLQFAFTCLHFISTGNVATFVQATITGPATAPFLMKYTTVASLSADYLNNVCDLPTPFPEHRYHVFVSEALLGSVSVACPTELQGLLTVITPNTACPASLTGCTSSTSVQQGDSTTCSCTGCAAPLYYATNPVRCLLNRTDSANSRSYVTLINPDLTQRFLCIVVKESTSTSTVSFSQRPLQCDESQSSTSATGGEAFTFGKETCPVVPGDGSLSATVLSIIGAVVAIIVIIIIVTVIIIIIICKRRRKREKEKKRLERRAQRREERRRRRLERQDRIRRGLPVSDLDSVSDSDSCYSTLSNTTLEETEERDDKDIFTKKRPITPKKLGKKFRKVYDEEGNLIHEEEIPMGSDDSGDETIYTVTEDGRQMKKRREKKTRNYIKERELPNGKKVKELVESDYWSTCSEESIESWEVDPVRAEIHLARLRRKKERDDMVLQLELAQPRQGPIVTRLMYEQKTGRSELRGGTKAGNFKKLARRKQKKVQESLDEEEEEDTAVDGTMRDQYLEQYMKKKRLEGVLEDEGFWDEERAKKTAEQIFEFERLDAVLEGKSAYKDIALVSNAADDEESSAKETSTQEVTVEDETKRKNSINRLKDKVRQKGKDEASVKFKEDGLSESDHDDDDKTRKQVTARVSQLLTQRLFGDDQSQDVKSALKLSESRKKGRVIFVEEMKQKQAPGTQPKRPKELAPIKKVAGKGSLPGQRRPAIVDPEKAAIYREGLAKDKNIVEALTAEDSWELGNDYENGDSDVEDKHSRLSPRKRRGQQTGHFPSVKGNTREAWGQDGLSPRLVDNDKVPYAVSAPKFHSYLNFLRGHGSADRPGHLTDRDASYCRGIRAPKRMAMDDARLRRLLEELYKDKKYMDTIIDAEESNDDEKVKQLANHGREYLLQMALYWEEKGPLPQRPSVTALGFKLERSKSAFIQDDPDTQRPTIARHKTVC